MQPKEEKAKKRKMITETKTKAEDEAEKIGTREERRY